MSSEFVASWFVRGKHLGDASVSKHCLHAEYHTPWSIAHCCSKCGVCYARIIIPDREFLFTRRLCMVHGPGLILPYEREYEAPPLALRYEILALRKVTNLANYDLALIFGDA